MAQFRLDYPVELEQAPARVNLPPLFTGDASSAAIGALVKNNGQDVSLSDGTCAGVVLTSDGGKVSRTGTISGNRAYITLSSACYVPGIIRVYLSVTLDGDTTTLIEASGVIRGVS